MLHTDNEKYMRCREYYVCRDKIVHIIWTKYRETRFIQRNTILSDTYGILSLKLEYLVVVEKRYVYSRLCNEFTR